MSNSLPFLVLGFLVLLSGWRQLGVVTLGLRGRLRGVRLAPLAAGLLTLGASGVVFGWLTYLLLRGFFSRQRRPDRPRGRGVRHLRRHPVGRAAERRRGLVAGPPRRGRRRRAGGLVAAPDAADAVAMTGGAARCSCCTSTDRPRHALRPPSRGGRRAAVVGGAPKGLPVDTRHDRLAVAGRRPRPRPRDVHRRRRSRSPTPGGGSWRTATTQRFVFVLHGRDGARRYALIDTGSDGCSTWSATRAAGSAGDAQPSPPGSRRRALRPWIARFIGAR